MEKGSRLKYREMSENFTAVGESTKRRGKVWGESLVEEHFAVVCLKCVMQHKLRKAMENVGGNFREFHSTQRMATLEKILHRAVIQ